MNHDYNQKLTDSINALPGSDPETIRGSAETMGRVLGEKSKSANVPIDNVINAFRGGLEGSYGTRGQFGGSEQVGDLGAGKPEGWSPDQSGGQRSEK